MTHDEILDAARITLTQNFPASKWRRWLAGTAT